VAAGSLRSHKRQLRRWALALPPRPPERRAGVLAQLRPLLEERPPGALALYIGLPSEPDPADLLEELWRAGWSTSVPRVEAGELQLRELRRGDPLLAGALGVLEPGPDGPAVDAEAIDVFLIPGLAFDRSGRRLGRGLGYYDRMLTRSHPDALRVGLCCSEQLVEVVPVGPLDQAMDYVVTEVAALRTATR
jgi:5-formyltetrahydrofolate cyclo-ligase